MNDVSFKYFSGLIISNDYRESMQKNSYHFTSTMPKLEKSIKNIYDIVGNHFTWKKILLITLESCQNAQTWRIFSVTHY